jgi:hypothetical protein
MRANTADALLNAIERGADGCWRFSHKIHHTGYVLLSFAGRQRQAHRVVYELMVGLVPTGLELDHLCRNRACVNPDHLEPVTHLENVRRGSIAQATHCKSGHEFTPENTKRQEAGFRQCRECHRLDGRRRYWARKAVAA